MTIDERLSGWGLGYAALQEDEGAKAAQNIGAALEAIETDKSLSIKDKISIADAISTFGSMTEDSVRLKPLSDAAPKIAELLTAIFLLPDDEVENYKNDGGEQDVAAKLAGVLTNYAYLSGDFVKAAWPGVVKLLGAVKDVPMKKATPLRSHGAPIVRLDTISSLMSFAPPYGSGVAAPEGLVETLVMYVGKDKPASEQAATAIQTHAATDPKLLETHMGAVFACYKAGVDSMKNVLMSSYNSAYSVDPTPFHENIDLIIDMDFMSSSGMLYAISDKNGKVLAPYTEKLVKMLEDGVQYSMETMVLTTLNGVANADPDSVYPFVDRIYKAGCKVPNGGITVAMVVGQCGKASDAEAPVKVVNLLGEMLTADYGAHAPPTIINGIVNQFGRLGGKTSVLDPHMKAILAHEASAGQQVEKVKDWHAGRSLEDTTNRLDALEAKVNAMNDEFAAKCADFDAVSKMMDEKIADLKDFVGEIVKKLPQPCKMTVESGVKKTLILHFKCANTGEEVTTQTKAWNQWVKVGFGLMKLGKCAAVAAAGNPMALASGAGAVKDIYGAFKTKDDKDFNTFIKQPFLTSAESDRLIEQLRDAKFFDKMSYDAQKGDWVLTESLSAEGMAKLKAKKAEQQATLDSVEHKKGKNMGLGSAKDIAKLAADVADTQGIEVREGTSANDALDKVTAAASAASSAKAAVKKGTAKKEPAKQTSPKMERSRTGEDKEVQQQASAPRPVSAPPVSTGAKRGFGGIFSNKKRDAKIHELEARIAQLESIVASLTGQ